jgi:hypothetical protein
LFACSHASRALCQPELEGPGDAGVAGAGAGAGAPRAAGTCAGDGVTGEVLAGLDRSIRGRGGAWRMGGGGPTCAGGDSARSGGGAGSRSDAGGGSCSVGGSGDGSAGAEPASGSRTSDNSCPDVCAGSPGVDRYARVTTSGSGSAGNRLSCNPDKPDHYRHMQRDRRWQGQANQPSTAVGRRGGLPLSVRPLQ